MADLTQLAIEALLAAKDRHDVLGAAGEESVQKNRFGDTALRCDLEAETAVLDVLRQAGLPITIISEEHGRVDLVDSPAYLGVLDGIDGSANYKKGRDTLRYGTILGIFDGSDPRYDDYLFSGFIEPATGRLFYAVRGGGAFLVEKGVTRTLRTSGATVLGTSVKIWADMNYDDSRGVRIVHEAFVDRLSGYLVACSGCLGAHYADVASAAKDLALACTRKDNLEIAGMYGLIREAGGSFVDSEGVPLGKRRYFSFGHDNHLPVIAAASEALALALVAHLKNTAPDKK